MPRITLGPNEPLEKALRRFKRKIEQEGIIRQLKERKHYEKPSVKKRKKRKNAGKNKTSFRGFRR